MSYNYDDDDKSCIIGTQFAPLEVDEIVSRKSEIDQTVRDERGRRRFHGAFTGGFSAGYWNTVGSAEGFTPKIFISSRKDKYDKSGFVSKPEDYMDEEDFGSFGIAPKKIHTKDDFIENFSFSSLKDSKMTFDEVIRSVFQPSKESIGKRLFRKMRRNAKLEEKSKDLILMEDKLIDIEKEDEHIYQPKVNRHGLGYKGMLIPENVLNTDSIKKPDHKSAVIATLKGGRRLKISGEAFGYGALEEDDAIDIYSNEDMSQYDFEIGTQIQKVQKKKPFKSNENSTIQLDGFNKSKEDFSLFQEIKHKYSTPKLPPGWKPKKNSKSLNKKSRWDDNQSKSDPIVSESNTFNQQKILNANLRAVILGESVIYKSGVAKEKVKTESKQLEFSREINKSNFQKLPIVTNIAKTPLSGYFASKFTRSSTSINEEPLSAGLNTFENFATTSTKNTDYEKNKDENLEPVRKIYEWHPHKILCKRFGVQNPFPQFPDIVGIVCVDPNDKSRNMTARLNATNPKKFLFTNIFNNLNNGSNKILTSEPVLTNQTKSDNENMIKTCTAPTIQANSNKEELTTNNDSTLVSDEIDVEEKPKPPIDLFKSIFASDEDEDEDDDDDDNEEENCQNQNENLASNNDSQRKNISKCDGIFSGVDFDYLKENFNPRLSNVKENEKNAQQMENDDTDEDYGPPLPPTISNNSETATTEMLKFKNKKTKKSKKKKSKSKKSKKKISKRRKRSSSESSFDSSFSSIDSETNSNHCVEDKIFELIKKVRHH